ncbi:MAG: hypothetical protein AAGC44_15630 [Planctomycetota bacterium]
MDERKKKWVAFSLAIVAFVTLVVGGYQAWLRVPPPIPENIDEVEALFDNPRYQRLSDVDKRPYQERINEMWGALNREDKNRLGEFFKNNDDVRQEAQALFLRGAANIYKGMYLSQNEEVRRATLDNIIDRGQQNRSNNESPSEYAAREKTVEEQEREREFMKQLFEVLDTGDAQNIGYISEMAKMMQKRREERGLPPF